MFSALRSASRHARRLPQQRRGFALGGSHGPPPEWEGVDKVVRGYFPEDYQCTSCVVESTSSFIVTVFFSRFLLFVAVAIAILSGYGGIYVLYKISSAFSKKKPVVEPAKPVAAAAPTTGIPALDSPAFDSFLETPAFEQLLESEDQLAKVVESA